MSEPRFRYFLSDVFLLVGLTLFLVSMFQPFMVLVDVSSSPRDSLRVVDFLEADFYSFKIDYCRGSPNVFSEWFTAYWFSHKYLSYNNIEFDPNICVMTFAFQILTLALAATTFRLRTRTRATLLISAAATTLFMTWLYSSLHLTLDRIYLGIYMFGPRFKWNLTAGYWFTYPSVLCFAISIILSRGRRN